MRRITGKTVYYYFVCKRKMWYFYNYIEMEAESDLVGIGAAMHDASFGRMDKNVSFAAGVSADFLTGWDVIHEVKKKCSVPAADVWQTKYYIYLARKEGLPVSNGMLHYTQEHTTEEVPFSSEDEAEMARVLEDIKRIVDGPVGGAEKTERICRSCAYFEFCMI